MFNYLDEIGERFYLRRKGNRMVMDNPYSMFYEADNFDIEGGDYE
jgi:hypothetical protein